MNIAPIVPSITNINLEKSNKRERIKEIKDEIRQVKEARARVKKFGWKQKIDRRLFGYHPYEKGSDKQANKILKKLKEQLRREMK